MFSNAARILRRRLTFLAAACAVALTTGGCLRGPVTVPLAQRKPIDRAVVDYQRGVLEEVARNLTAAIDCEPDAQGNVIVAESGEGGYEPHIFGIRPDGTQFQIYPAGRPIRVPFDLYKIGYRIYGPIGGIALASEPNKVYVAHRTADGNGEITAFGYDGSHTTIISAIPCRGDHALSDIALGRERLWFGVGSATNSGVVGIDNWNWVKKYPEFCDRSRVDLTLNGFQFKSKHPDAGLFGAPEIAVTAPFQPFNASGRTLVQHSDFPTSTIYSIEPGGGDKRIEAYGIRAPVGLTFSEFGSLYMTNQGMELRGTRPIKDDPDSLLKVVGGWYGWPDYSTDLQPITGSKFQLTGDMVKLLIRSGYDSIRFLIDHNASANGEGLPPPPSNLVQATFPPLAGAGRFDFVPAKGPLKNFEGQVIIPLSGDRAPYATSGRKLNGPVGFKVVRVDLARHEVQDLIANARGGPASAMKEGEGLLERPVSVKFGPDGSLYIVDFGKLDVKSNGREKVKPMSGRILRLRASAPASQPASAAAARAGATSRK